MTTKQQPPCFTCEEYQYIGEGDAICIENDPVVIQENWELTMARCDCEKFNEWLMRLILNA